MFCTGRSVLLSCLDGDCGWHHVLECNGSLHVDFSRLALPRSMLRRRLVQRSLHYALKSLSAAAMSQIVLPVIWWVLYPYWYSHYLQDWLIISLSQRAYSSLGQEISVIQWSIVLVKWRKCFGTWAHEFFSLESWAANQCIPAERIQYFSNDQVD